MRKRKCDCCGFRYEIGSGGDSNHCNECIAVRQRDPVLFDWFVKVMENRIEQAIDEHDGNSN